MENTLESLAARVDFLERWIAVPVCHLPGYVAPEVEETTNAEGNSQGEQLPVLDGKAE